MKQISSVELFNMMNDNRHLAIIDIRSKEEFERKQIRGSICIQDELTNVKQYITNVNKNAEKNEEKYKIQPIRRFIIISDDPQTIDQQKEICLELVNSINKDKQYRICYLKVSLEEFFIKYPFLCLSKNILQNYEQNEQNDDQIALLYSYSQFPQELIENKIFLGSNYNSNSKKQLESLHIKTILDFKQYDQEIEEWKKQNYKYINFPISEEQIIDFIYITELIESSPQPILLCCPDGNLITNIIAIGYLMTIKKQNFNIASLKVFQIRGNTQVNKTLYSQIMTYNPIVK